MCYEVIVLIVQRFYSLILNGEILKSVRFPENNALRRHSIYEFSDKNTVRKCITCFQAVRQICMIACLKRKISVQCMKSYVFQNLY